VSVDRRLLASLMPFAGLADAALDDILASARSRFVEARQRVSSAGGEVDVVLVIVSGRVEVASETADGNRSMLGVLIPGAIIGDAAALDRDGFALETGTFAVTATAIEDTLLLAIDPAYFCRLVETDARFAGNIARGLARRLRMMIVRDAWMMSLSVPARLARFITWLADTEGLSDRSGPLHLRMRLPQDQLGAMIGATRESVNKYLREWSKAGIVEHASGRISILDRARLQALAEDKLELLAVAQQRR
jgi:CRP/FNR family cyclic AMP-dependent transcriptional regulator